MPSLCHLFVDCWHVVCFCFSFQFFHAQYYTEEVLCIPCQFQYVLPAHSFTLLSFCILHHYSSFSSSSSILSPFWTSSRCFELTRFCSLLRFARGMLPHATCLHPESPGAPLRAVPNQMAHTQTRSKLNHILQPKVIYFHLNFTYSNDCFRSCSA